MNLAAVTVCVAYAGELSHTLPVMKLVCDDVIVITTNDDEETAMVACDNDAEAVEYDGFYQDGALFNKSGAVRLGQTLMHTRHPGWWYLVVDADILLPPDLKTVINMECKDREALYGIVRHDVETFEEYQSGAVGKKFTYPFAGFFHLYSDTTKLYAPYSPSAAKCDCDFAKLFERKIRLNSNVKHLGYNTKNWHGRSTPKWPRNWR